VKRCHLEGVRPRVVCMPAQRPPGAKARRPSDESEALLGAISCADDKPEQDEPSSASAGTDEDEVELQGLEIQVSLTRVGLTSLPVAASPSPSAGTLDPTPNGMTRRQSAWSHPSSGRDPAATGSHGKVGSACADFARAAGRRGLGQSRGADVEPKRLSWGSLGANSK
jgi:hypothetical protein